MRRRVPLTDMQRAVLPTLMKYMERRAMCENILKRPLRGSDNLMKFCCHGGRVPVDAARAIMGTVFDSLLNDDKDDQGGDDGASVRSASEPAHSVAHSVVSRGGTSVQELGELTDRTDVDRLDTTRSMEDARGIGWNVCAMLLPAMARSSPPSLVLENTGLWGGHYTRAK